MPNRIRKETDNIIILDTSKFSLFTSGIVTLIFIGLVLYFFNHPFGHSNPYDSFVFLLSAGLAGLGILKILLDLQVVIISKKSQSVAIRFLYITIKEIPFSNIENVIYFDRGHGDPESAGSWVVNLTTTQGDSIEIYHTGNESVAEILAEKIREITDKEISYPYQKDSHPFRWQ